MDFTVEPCDRGEIQDFVEKWHYSHQMNGVISNYSFKLLNRTNIIGAMVYGKLAMANVWKKYVDSRDDLIELRRLCCIDDTPKNTESYFIGKTIRWLRNNTNIRKIISYADPEFGHQGTIYKASNFQYVGKTSPGRVILWNGKRYHDKDLRSYYKGRKKPFVIPLENALKSGEATYKKTLGKHIYLFDLRNKATRRL